MNEKEEEKEKKQEPVCLQKRIEPNKINLMNNPWKYELNEHLMQQTTNEIPLNNNNRCDIATMLTSNQNRTDNINCNAFIYRNQDGTPTQATASIQQIQHFQQASIESGVRLFYNIFTL